MNCAEFRTGWSIIYEMSLSRDSVDLQKTPVVPGRPRQFLRETALQGALEVLWRKGFGATSLDDLTQAMQLSRSSLYACFGSKRGVFVAAIQAYADECFATFSTVAKAAPDPLGAVRVVLAAIADADGGTRGCFFANSVTELAPHDAELAAYSQGHIARVAALVTDLLIHAGFAPQLAQDRAGAALALAMGAITLRKAGIPAARIQLLLDQAQMLLVLPDPLSLSRASAGGPEAELTLIP